jgi:hypothetical protein
VEANVLRFSGEQNGAEALLIFSELGQIVHRSNA